MTGNKLTSLRTVNFPLKNILEMRIVKSGVDARTTWWNCVKESANFRDAFEPQKRDVQVQSRAGD
jgi:hypothetical protein